MKRIYLDHAAATPLDPSIKRAMAPYLGSAFGNPSALYESGRKARKAIDAARVRVAEILHAHPDEIIFTGSGTEADALALYGVLRAHKGNLVTTSVEHAAVLLNARALEKEGVSATYIEPNEEGFINPQEVARAIDKNTTLVSVMYANNEIGTIEPIREIAKVVRKVREERRKLRITTPLFFHTDACQAAGYLDLNVEKPGIDLMALNASKMYGPKGVGVLYVRRGTPMKPLWEGGGQEAGNRSGTENVAGIIGFAKALEIAEKKKEKESKRLVEIRDYFIDNLMLRIPNTVLNGPKGEERLPNNINISIPGMDGETMLAYLDVEGIEASTGSACEAKSTQASHVMMAIGRGSLAHSTLRFTLGRTTTKKDADRTVEVLAKTTKLLQKIPSVFPSARE